MKKKLALSVAAFVGLFALLATAAAYQRTFHPRYTESKYDREPY